MSSRPSRAALRALHIDAGRRAGIDVLPVGDFALYDHVLDAAEMAGIVAERHRGASTPFAAARGADGVRPLELTKWFDTNYHYLVPELDPERPFRLDAGKWLGHLAEAGEAPVRPVVLGPFSLLLLSKGTRDGLALLPALAGVYAELLAALAGAGAREVALDEPCLALDRSEAELDAFSAAYERLTRRGPRSPSPPTSRRCRTRRSDAWPSWRPPSCTSTSCAPRSSSAPRSRSSRIAPGSRQAWWTGATSGPRTSTTRSTSSTAPPPRSGAIA